MKEKEPVVLKKGCCRVETVLRGVQSWLGCTSAGATRLVLGVLGKGWNQVSAWRWVS